ncbi:MULTISPECIES: DUF6573 family protein [unclassified Thiomonas]|jgi:hypothetical protein|uniref:DUF6573 family protein n=1 Tax=unclassified Thiomonas TaxID=2625466 RepID=UPI000BD3EF58|nr:MULTISPECIES: DUF6573 family protein [unclassified Thiomonas]OZB72197.1 MAG: hypothetical protein B7X30_01005 [Thiomonas sp. 13-64-67]
MQTNTATTMTAIFGEPISTYTRVQAIEDGVLIDISITAREAGIVWPVAMTAAAWADCVEWTDQTESRKGYTGQSESGRLWDVCWMLSRVVLRAARLGLTASPAHPMYVELLRTPREGRGVKPRLVHLKFVVGPDDAGRPCITVMMPSED